jgi:hypothetical protein
VGARNGIVKEKQPFREHTLGRENQMKRVPLLVLSALTYSALVAAPARAQNVNDIDCNSSGNINARVITFRIGTNDTDRARFNDTSANHSLVFEGAKNWVLHYCLKQSNGQIRADQIREVRITFTDMQNTVQLAQGTLVMATNSWSITNLVAGAAPQTTQAPSAVPQTGQAGIRILGTRWNLDYCQSGGTASVTVLIADWRELKNSSDFERLIVAMRSEGLSRCPRGWHVVVSMVLDWNQYHVAKAQWYGTTKRWSVESSVEQLERQEAAREAQKANELAEQKRREELLQKLKQAVADCPRSTQTTGGPWFSSTYKQAALDNASRLALSASQIQHEMSRLGAAPDPNVLRQLDNIANNIGRDMDTWGKPFLCVKEVRYVGPAVNPMGGNAARAVFVGYGTQSKDFGSVSYTHDFPY